MTTLEFGDLQIVAGGRWEHTSMAYEGKRLVLDGSGQFQELIPSEASAT